MKFIMFISTKIMELFPSRITFLS